MNDEWKLYLSGEHMSAAEIYVIIKRTAYIGRKFGDGTIW